MKKTLLNTLIITIILFAACSGSDTSDPCPDASCTRYSTQAEAQTAYDGDPDCMAALDHDNDQIACEHLSGSGSGTGGGSGGGSNCPTTGNCGCSNKTKSQCASACCQWIVGEGCRCR